MAKNWDRQELRLKKDHGWTALPGHRILILDRGAVRFDIPQRWQLQFGEGSVKIYDKLPEKDANCRLEVSVMYLPPIDWSGLPLRQLVQDVVIGDKRDLTDQGPIHQDMRPDLELAWTEVVFTDPIEHREARSRICLARSANIQTLITFDFWPEHAERLGRVWDDVLSTLRLGQYVEDPTQGPRR